jgi:hypothetical protein
MAKFKKFFKKWPKTLAFGVVLGRFIPWIGGVLIAIDTIQGITKGWEEAKAEPDANFATKLWGAARGGTLVLWDFFITQLFDMVGWIAKWLTTNALKLMGFDEAAGKIEKGPEWNIGTKATEGWTLLLEALGILWDEIATSIWKGDESLVGRIGTFMEEFSWSDLLDDFPSWSEIMDAIKPDWWKKLMGAENQITKTPKKDVVDNLKGKLGIETPNVIDTAKKLGSTINSTAGKGVDAVKGFGANVGQTFTDTSKSLITGGISGAKAAKKKLGGAWDGFKSGLSSAFSFKKEPTSHKPIKDDGGTTNMSGVKWNDLHDSGRKGVESAIWSIYDAYGKTPTFVSGLRDKKHRLYNPKSQHAVGKAFDLRSKDLGNDRESISSDLNSFFKNVGWFFQEEIAGQANKTGTKATGDHFHMHKAAQGWHGEVNEATGFIAGERGRERVDIWPKGSFKPGVDPANMTNIMRGMGGAMGGFGDGGLGAITTIVDSSTNTHNATVLAVGNGPHPASIDDGLHR